MARIGINILKRCAFRGGIQHFSNTYYYENVAAAPGVSTANALIDEVVVSERFFHSTAVTFVLGRCWTAGGTAAQNVMITEHALSGTGSGSANSGVDPERAFLLQWPAGLDSRGRQVYLRKWYHPVGNSNVVTILTGHQNQSQAFSTAERNALTGIADDLTSIGAVETLDLVSRLGRDTTAPVVAHPWFEHHQFGEEWRGT